MGASSVTGVGQGSADKAGQKGSEHLYVGVEKLIGTRIVLSGVTKLTGSTTVVKLPTVLPGVWSGTFDQTETNPADSAPPAVSDYIVLTTTYHATRVAGVTAMTTTSGVQNFTINGTTADYVFWSVIRHSNATVTAFPTHH